MLCCMAIATLTWIWHGDMWQILFDTFQKRHDFMIGVFVLHMLDVLIMEPRQPQRWPPYILLVLSLPFAIYQFVMFEKNGYLRCRKRTNSQRKKKRRQRREEKKNNFVFSDCTTCWSCSPLAMLPLRTPLAMLHCFKDGEGENEKGDRVGDLCYNSCYILV